MNDTLLHSIEQIETFLTAAGAVEFHFESTPACYAWIQATLVRLRYAGLSKPGKGVLRRYVQAVTGYSRAQAARLIGQYRKGVQMRGRKGERHRFERRYTAQDVRLLAKTDELHGTLSGPATKKIFEREYRVFGHLDFARLASIFVGHLYNLRKQTGYLRLRQCFTKTRARIVAIGERRKPAPEGRPGYLRIDSVHQGDQDGVKGVYHINVVDAVTQFQAVAAVEKISEAYLIPALKELLAAFPFVILGFHSDNGSEYVNRAVAELLNKLLIEFTKSRSRQTNDNALVEGKNAATIRKHFGYAHIPQRYAARINAFNREHLVPYLTTTAPASSPKSSPTPKESSGSATTTNT